MKMSDFLSKLIPSFIKWRYEVYLSEYVDLYGSISFYLKMKCIYFQYLWFAKPQAIYIYANKRNVGDYISHCGVKKIVGLDGPALFCTPIYFKRFKKHMASFNQAHPNTPIIIGGGGLLQSVFTPFWDYIVSAPNPYCLVGLGINKMPGRKEMAPALLQTVIDKAAFVTVRDTYSANRLFEKPFLETQCLSICPSINYFHQTYFQEHPENNNYLLHVVHPSDLRLAGADKNAITQNLQKIAKYLGLSYKEHSNMNSNHKEGLASIHDARLVVSSRLHGCIMSYGMGIPFLALYCDDKTASFLSTHTQKKGISATEAEDVSTLQKEVERCIDTFDNEMQNVTDKINQNQKIGHSINRLFNAK